MQTIKLDGVRDKKLYGFDYLNENKISNGVRHERQNHKGTGTGKVEIDWQNGRLSTGNQKQKCYHMCTWGWNSTSQV